MIIKFKQLREKYKIRATTKDGEKFTSKDYKTKKDAVDAMYDLKHFTKSGQKGRFKSIDLVKENKIDNVKKAVEIAKKMAGNMTGAIKEIEKIQKGLSKHIRVADALRLANEEAPANATGAAVAGTGDDSSTV